MTSRNTTQNSLNSQKKLLRKNALRVPRFLRVMVVIVFAFVAVIDAQVQRPVFRSGTELVLVNVVVRDKAGTVVRNLTRDDFIVTEDDKPQVVTSFDFEELDKAAAEAAAPGIDVAQTILPQRPAARASDAQPVQAAPKVDMRGRRLIVLFFDLSSMQPEELQRAVTSAHEYVEQKLSPVDMIAVASFSTSLRVDQDFTADKEALTAAIDAFGDANGQGFDAADSSDDASDNGNAFSADDTEFSIFNTDRRLDALQSLADALSGIQQKKSVIYFSSGMSQQGSDNQVQLRRTIDRANRANVSLYAADMRGLQAAPPGGDATQGSRRGTGAFSGAAVASQVSRMAASQDTLTSIAEDTGGRAFFDANTFTQVFQRVVADTSAYYILGYSSTNPAEDGRFRRIRVRLKRADLKLEYRSGYYAGRDFAHSSKEDKEQQLQDQLVSDLSSTDISAYVSTAYFRLADNRYYIPISVVMPGYQVPLAKTIDVLGLVRDDQKRPVGRIRDTVRLAGDGADAIRKKTVQYETGMEMPPGKFHLKIVVRENGDGTFGSYETDIVVPDLKKDQIKLSSIVVGTQLQAVAKKNDRNPLSRDGRELVPNVTRVVSSGQHLYFYYELYDPARTPMPKVLTSIAFFRGRVRVFETPLVESTTLSGPEVTARNAAVFQFDVPAASLPPGLYTCQINVIDDTAGTFAFPRVQLLVRK